MEATPNPNAHPAGNAGLKDALRIQAAAVAAQQAALTEEEGRLEKRRIGLEQQEAQLAAHLNEKHRRLVEIRDQTRQERQKLEEERTAQEQRHQEAQRQLEQDRGETADSLKQAQAERRRLLDLRKKLKRRWHRQWAAERAAMRHHEQELAERSRMLQQEKESLHQEKAKLIHLRLRWNGEVEVDRRRIIADRDSVQQQRSQWEERHRQEDARFRKLAHQLDLREAELTQTESDLAEEKRLWESNRRGLEQEIEGLENRSRNQRRNLLEHEQEVVRLKTLLRELQNRVAPNDPSGSAADQTLPTPSLLPTAGISQDEGGLRLSEEEQKHLATLEKISGELEDQRLYLTEQHELLVQAQQRWHEERHAAATELEALTLRLQEREQTLDARAQSVEAAEGRCVQRREDLAHLQEHLETREAQMLASSVVWEGERERRLADLQSREQLVERRQDVMADLRRRWQERRGEEVQRLRAHFAVCKKLRKECAALREEWLERRLVLHKDQRTLLDRALAIKQYLEDLLNKASDRVVAEKRLERLRRQWSALSAAADKALSQEREAIENDAALLEESYAELQELADRVSRQEADLSARELALEEVQTVSEEGAAQLRQELHVLRTQRQVYERRVADLTNEVERLARLLLGPDEPPAVAAAQAA